MRKRNRIVVKVGSSTLTDANGMLDHAFIGSFVTQIAELSRMGYAPIIVSSAAIAAGIEGLGLKSRPRDIPTLQAAASVGQVALVEAYARAFSTHGLIVGQILLTRNDTASRQAYLHARDTFERLIELEAIPIVNENDTVAIDEICFGDNDTLAALVAMMVDAKQAVMLTDVDGLYTADPRTNADAEHVDTVHTVDEALMSTAAGAGTCAGTGGMVTKLRAARLLLKAGIEMVLCDGAEEGAILKAVNRTSSGTYFTAENGEDSSVSLSQRKRWIALGGTLCGSIIVDDGAVSALRRGGVSLLGAGIISVEGDFSENCAIGIVSERGDTIARGLSRFSSEEIADLAGKQNSGIAEMFPDKSTFEVVHCDDLVLF